MAVALIVPDSWPTGFARSATIWIADLTDIVEAATGFDHIVYGWVFFGARHGGRFIALGWRWFDRPADAPAFDPASVASDPVSNQLSRA